MKIVLEEDCLVVLYNCRNIKYSHIFITIQQQFILNSYLKYEVPLNILQLTTVAIV